MIDEAEIRFDGWRLRVATGELTRDGKTQRLTQQPLRILMELLENAGRVVTRERLVQLLWPKGIVDFDNGLNVAVRKLRMALGDDTETPRYIETLPRVGYRFIGALETAPVEEAAAHVEPKPRRPPWLVPVVAGIVAIAGAAWWLWPRAPDLESTPMNGERISSAAEKPIVARRTTSVRAYEHYLQGIFHRSRRDVQGTDLAIASLEAALREDPDYAEAWAALGDTYVGAAIGHHTPARAAFTRAREAALKAVALDPGIAETHTALAQIDMFFTRDYTSAEARYNQALALNEKYARLWHHVGMLRAFQGRADEALAAMRRARELEPMTLLYNSNYGLLLYHSRRYQEAADHARQLLETQPALHQSRSVLTRALVALGDLDAALAELPLRTSDLPNVSDAALVYAKAGRRADALREIARIERMSSAGFGVGYELAIVHAALGDLAAGCEALALAERDASPFLGWMRLDPRMDALRGEQCFKDVDARLGTGKP